jgi:hypothetical protein
MALALLALALTALAAGDLIGRGDLVDSRRFIWLVTILLPLVGPALYYVNRPPRKPVKGADAYAKEQLATVTSLRREGVISAEEYDCECTALAGMAEATSRSNSANGDHRPS